MSVLRWLLGRLAAAALVAWVVATVVFFALRAAGGDPSEAILGGPGSQAGEEAVARVRAEYALDQPLLVQYLLQLARTVTFQLGDSYARRRPVSELVGDQLGGRSPWPRSAWCSRGSSPSSWPPPPCVPAARWPAGRSACCAARRSSPR